MLDFLCDIFARNQSAACSKLIDRLDYNSKYFLGRPYIGGALGEGDTGEFDQQPQYRFDGFDCVTYVNTVLALTYAKHWSEFRYHLARLSYRSGVVQYQKRHHFMSVDWNIENAHCGYVADVTPNILNTAGYSVCDYASAYIDRPSWFKRRTLANLHYQQPLNAAQLKQKLALLHQLAARVRGQYACTPYLPLTQLLPHAEGGIATQIAAQFPVAAVVEIVRPRWDLIREIGTELNVSHVGIVLKRNQELVLRHASQEKQRVVEELLADYLRRYLHSPTVKGINLQAILAA